MKLMGTKLVAGLEHGFYDFPYIGKFIIPTDELIFFRGVGIPPTRIVHIPMITQSNPVNPRTNRP
jgi:hypothetical protein